MTQESGAVKKTINWIRPLAVFLMLILFAADYGFNVMAKPVPKYVYWALLGCMVGIDAKDMKSLILTVLKNAAEKQ